MAKYQIERSCGHTETVNIGGKVKDRDRKAEWEATRLCWDCYREQQAQAEQAPPKPKSEYRAGQQIDSITVNDREVPVRGRPAWRKNARGFETASALVEGAGPMSHRHRSAMLSLFFGDDKRPGHDGAILVVKVSLGLGSVQTLHEDGLASESEALPRLLSQTIEWFEGQRQSNLDIAPNRATRLTWLAQEEI